MRKLFLFSILIFSLNVTAQQDSIVGIHLLNYNTDDQLVELQKRVPMLSKMGLNTIFLEIDYHYQFESHPELWGSSKAISFEAAQSFSKTCQKHNIEVVPQFQCVGHQSWAKTTFSLLTEYPEFDLTPGAFPNNDSIYCREWDVTNPKINEIAFELIDEIMTAFNAKGIHVGMDEIFLLGHPKSPTTYGMNPASLFAKAVNEFHDYLVEEKGYIMYMWGDRLINGAKYGYGSWEASMNGTYPAIDSIPKDIVICDWHYNVQQEYPSVPMFIEKGFRVLPCSWKDPEAVGAFIRYTYPMESDKMLGHMFTTWSTKMDELVEFQAMLTGLDIIQKRKFHDVYFNMVEMDNGSYQLELKTVDPELDIKYSLKSDDMSQATTYKEPIQFNAPIDIYAQAYRDGEPAGEKAFNYYVFHKAIGKPVKVLSKMSDKYATEFEERTLVNGVYETVGFGDGNWLGFEGEPMEVVIDFENKVSLKTFSANFHNEVNSWIHHPNEVKIYGKSDAGEWTLIGEWSSRSKGKKIVNVTIDLKPGKYQEIKVVAENKNIPAGFNGEGSPAWIFVDELVFN